MGWHWAPSQHLLWADKFHENENETHQGHDRTLRPDENVLQVRPEPSAISLRRDLSVSTAKWRQKRPLSAFLSIGAWMCPHVHTCVYVSVYVLWAVQRPGQAVRDYGVWVCVCVGWGGGWVSQNPDPIWPCSAQKVWREWLQAADCRLADGVEGKLAVRQTAEAEKSKSDSGGEMEEMAHKEANKRLKKQNKSKQMERREWWILIGRVSGHIITDNMHLFWFVLPLNHTRLSIFHHKNWVFSMHTTAQT